VGIAVGAAVAVALLGVAVAALLGWRPRRRPSKQLAADVIHQLPHSSRSSFSSSSKGSPTKQAAERKVRRAAGVEGGKQRDGEAVHVYPLDKCTQSMHKRLATVTLFCVGCPSVQDEPRKLDIVVMAQ
jgi:hypothetical protein